MSIVYKVREKLTVDASAADGSSSRNPAGGAVISGMLRRLVGIAEAMLLEESDVQIRALTLTADGERLDFSGNTVTAVYHEILRHLSRAVHAELTLEFRFTSHGDPALLDSPARDAAEALAKAAMDSGGDPREMLRGVLYRYWYVSELNDNAGFLYVYGEDSGTLCLGRTDC